MSSRHINFNDSFKLTFFIAIIVLSSCNYLTSSNNPQLQAALGGGLCSPTDDFDSAACNSCDGQEQILWCGSQPMSYGETYWECMSSCSPGFEWKENYNNRACGDGQICCQYGYGTELPAGQTPLVQQPQASGGCNNCPPGQTCEVRSDGNHRCNDDNGAPCAPGSCVSECPNCGRDGMPACDLAVTNGYSVSINLGNDGACNAGAGKCCFLS